MKKLTAGQDINLNTHISPKVYKKTFNGVLLHKLCKMTIIQYLYYFQK